jgi:hypothetical protein
MHGQPNIKSKFNSLRQCLTLKYTLNTCLHQLQQSQTFRSPFQSMETPHILLNLFIHSYCLINVYKIDTTVSIISKCQPHKDKLRYGLRGYDVVCGG